jgi:hypothetical protein
MKSPKNPVILWDRIYFKSSVFRHAKLLKSSIICDITPYNLGKVSWCLRGTCRLHIQCFLLASSWFLSWLILFDPEDGGNVFLQNVNWRSLEYTALYPGVQNSSHPPLWEPEISRVKFLLMKICMNISNHTSVDTLKSSEAHLGSYETSECSQ